MIGERSVRAYRKRRANGRSSSAARTGLSLRGREATSSRTKSIVMISHRGYEDQSPQPRTLYYAGIARLAGKCLPRSEDLRFKPGLPEK